MVSAPPRRVRYLGGFGLALFAFGACVSDAPDAPPALQLAVAANFAAVAEELARDFEAGFGVPVRLSVGSTGSLYAQIVNGAPHHVLLAADDERPRLLEEGGYAVAGTRFVYAVGRLVVYAPGRTDAWTVPEILTEPGARVAWAEPRTAPYGAAARSALEQWGLGGLEGAVGESVGQTLQFALSGSVDVVFVGRAQVADAPRAEVRELAVEVAPPIPQEAVLLKAGADVRAATDFLEFLRSAEGRARIRAGGYDLPTDGAHGG